MKATCYICGKKETDSQERLMEKGWQGASGNLNGQYFKFELCQEHHLLADKVLLRIKDGHPVRKNTDGKYTCGCENHFDLSPRNPGKEVSR